MNSGDLKPLQITEWWGELLRGATRHTFEGRLPAYLLTCRWFRGKSRIVLNARFAEEIRIPGIDAVVGIVSVTYKDGPHEEYVLPLMACCGDEAGWVRTNAPHLVVCECVYSDGSSAVVCDALGIARFQRIFFALLGRGAAVGESCAIRFRQVGGPLPLLDVQPRSLKAEQSNTSIAFGDQVILKVTRRLEEGVSADLEMGEFLTRAGYVHAPAVRAAAEVLRPLKEPATLAIAHAFVANEGDAWSVFVDFVARAITSTNTLPVREEVLMRRLGTRVAELHHALGSREDISAFSIETIEEGERRTLAMTARASLTTALVSLARRTSALTSSAQHCAVLLRARRPELEERLERFIALGCPLPKMRVHGDLHLGQVLFTGDDFFLIDFEGEPGRSLHERKLKRCPLADIAGMLRSLHYASLTAARTRGAAGADGRAATWYAAASAAFIDAYYDATRDVPFLPADLLHRQVALDYYLVEKCVYEIQYELDNRPGWVELPILGLLGLLENSR